MYGRALSTIQCCFSGSRAPTYIVRPYRSRQLGVCCSLQPSRAWRQSVVKSAHSLVKSPIETKVDEEVNNIEAVGCNDDSSQASGSLLGAVALITSCTVGAGILALPAFTLNSGVVPATQALGSCWILLVFQAYILADLNLKLHEKRKFTEEHNVISLGRMAVESLGEHGGEAVRFVYYVYAYTMLVAYVAKGGDVLDQIINIHGIGSPLFATAMGSMLWLGGTNGTEVVNRYLTVMMLTLFAAVLSTGSTHADWQQITAWESWTSVPRAFPVLFLSLVYHDLIPVVCNYLKYDRTKILYALLFGSLVPFLMFASWNTVALCSVPATAVQLASSGVFVDPLEYVKAEGSMVSAAVQGFSLVAGRKKIQQWCLSSAGPVMSVWL